jgi:methionyl-tRNA formyltransferase
MQGYSDDARADPGAERAPPLSTRQSPAASARSPDFSLNRLYYFSDAASPPLRIGVMINRSRALPLFMRKVLEDVRSCNFANLECVIENCEPPAHEQTRAALPVRAATALLDPERRRRLLHDAYVRRLNKSQRGMLDPLTPTDCSDLFESVPRIPVVPLRKRFVHRFPAEAVDAIRALDLDVILRFGFNIIRGDILDTARHGIWSFHHGDSERYRGGPPLLWELLEGNPLSGAVLQRLDESLDAGTVLCRGILATWKKPDVRRNRYNVYWSTQHFVIQSLHALHRYGPEHIRRRTRACGEYRGRRPIYRMPSNFEMARWLVPQAAKLATRKLRKPKEPWQWRIGLRRSNEPLYRRPEGVSPAEFTWLDCPREKFWADPFLLERDGATWVFFENFDYAQRRAVIDCGRLEAGRLVDVRTVLDRPEHLSFPHVFEHDGAVWMIPESEQAGAVNLYRAARFPDQWVLERTLLDMRAVDPVPFMHCGRWYMFVSPVVVDAQVPFTLLFTARQLVGPWTLHPAGCISSDVRFARSGGAVIRDGQRLIRVSQECAEGYGHSVCFSAIELDEATFEEQPYAQLLPEALGDLAGVHTYNRAGDWEVIDGRRLRPALDSRARVTGAAPVSKPVKVYP